MRRLELVTDLPASAADAWSVLVDTERWSDWGGLVTSAQGAFVEGHRWTMRLRGADGGPSRTMTPRFVSMQEPTRVVFETRILGRRSVSLTHIFDVEAVGPTRSRLRQTFEARGVLVPLLWRSLRSGMAQFDELGGDLARRLANGGPSPATTTSPPIANSNDAHPKPGGR